MRCVPAPDFTVAKALAWRSAIHDDPPYQREGLVWSLAKQQLFIDSLLNGYDVPKIYLHDLRGRHPTLVYAVVDGRQRLTAMWQFLTDGFALADDFRIEPANRPPLPDRAVDPVAGQRFSDFHPAWQRALRTTPLSVVLIQNATEDDIEDLFSRLNNGEPLTAAEKRNALGGAIADLAREAARRPFFRDRVRFSNARSQHLEAATRLIMTEHADPPPAGPFPDLRSRALDAFVISNRRLPASAREGLRSAVLARLDRLERVFRSGDPLLGQAPSVTLAHLLDRALVPDPPAPGAVRAFLERFDASRRAALQGIGDAADEELVEFTELAQHGPHRPRNLERRVAIVLAAWRRDARRRLRSA